MKKSILAFTLLILWMVSLDLRAQSHLELKKQRIDSLMQATLVHEGKHPVHNFMLYVQHPASGLDLQHGVGYRGRDESPIEADDQFKIASITKTFVSVITLQLLEEGKLQLDDKIGPYVQDRDYLKFEEFLIYDGGPVSQDITVEQCLRHLSGVADIFTDKETRFVLSVLFHKKREYDVPKVIKRYYKYKLHKQPTSRPGEGYHYSDMNYMLLGFMIEKITGKSLPQNIRERILEPLNMKNTYFEYYEDVHGKDKQVDTYINKINITKKINTSYEWAGGGLISNTRELGVFIQALFAQKLFQNAETLENMIDLHPAQAFDKDAGMGIFRYELNGLSFYGHGGYYGSLMLYCPEQKLTIVANIGQSNADLSPRKLIGSVVDAVVDKGM